MHLTKRENNLFYEFLLCVSKKSIYIYDIMRYIFSFYEERFLIQFDIGTKYFILVKDSIPLSTITVFLNTFKKYSNEYLVPNYEHGCVTIADLKITDINKNGEIKTLYNPNVYSAVKNYLYIYTSGVTYTDGSVQAVAPKKPINYCADDIKLVRIEERNSLK